MSKWYIRQDGESRGPFETDELRMKIERRELRPIDFVYNKVEKSWHLVSEIKDFQSTLMSPATFDTEWIVLQVRGAKRRVLGPFSTATIFRQLATGDLGYSDLVWSSGAMNWSRIGDLDALDRRRLASTIGHIRRTLNSDEPVPLIEATRERLLANIYRVSQKTAQSSDPIPEDAQGEDLADATRALQHQIASKLKVFSIVFLGCVMVASATAQAETTEVVAIRAAASEPTVLIHTDAPIGSRIELKLTQALGDVPGLYDLSRTFTMEREAGEVPTVSLEDLNLQPGTYRVSARVNHHEVRQRFFRGTRNAAFNEALALFRKEVSFFQQEQKKALFYGARKLTRLTKRMTKQISASHGQVSQNSLQAWREDLRRIETSIAASVAKRSSAYPERHEQMMEATQKLRTEFALLSGNVSANRDVASADRAEPASTQIVDLGNLTRLESQFASLQKEIGRSVAPGD